MIKLRTKKQLTIKDRKGAEIYFDQAMDDEITVACDSDSYNISKEDAETLLDFLQEVLPQMGETVDTEASEQTTPAKAGVVPPGLTYKLRSALAVRLECSMDEVKPESVATLKWWDLRHADGIGQKSLISIRQWMKRAGYTYSPKHGWQRDAIDVS